MNTPLRPQTSHLSITIAQSARRHQFLRMIEQWGSSRIIDSTMSALWGVSRVPINRSRVLSIILLENVGGLHAQSLSRLIVRDENKTECFMIERSIHHDHQHGQLDRLNERARIETGNMRHKRGEWEWKYMRNRRAMSNRSNCSGVFF